MLPSLTPEDVARISPKFEQCVNLVRPEAKELLQSFSSKLETTKDHYGSVLQVVGSFPASMFCSFLYALIEEGYPADTARNIAEMSGKTAAFDRFGSILYVRTKFDAVK